MDVDYICFKCKVCKCEFVMLEEDIKRIGNDRYISCPYGHKDVEIEDRADTVKDCMKERSYDKRRGIVRQTRYDT